MIHLLPSVINFCDHSSTSTSTTSNYVFRCQILLWILTLFFAKYDAGIHKAGTLRRMNTQTFF